jgi:DegT/DnrJ/EryC1/StrS aminotransferase family protein
MSGPAREIEDFFSRRYGREALYVPSGRLALYLAFREWLRPGDPILLSPIDDDVVFFTVLAAGLTPVLGPVDPRTGNLDPARVPESVWSGLKAVLTTNLYGIPDRMELLAARCRRHSLVLVEDACQALDSSDGDRRIGQFGPVAAFSLSKHVGGAGGVLVFADGERRRALARRIQEEVRQARWSRAARAVARRLRHGLRAAAPRLGQALDGARLKLTAPALTREGHRMPYEAAEVLEAARRGGGLDRFDRWVGVDDPQYRTATPRAALRETLGRLRAFEEDRQLRLEGAARLMALGLTPPGLAVPPDRALFRVPLFVQDRERVREDFARLGLELDYIYDPPLDRYARAELGVLAVPSPPEARPWSRHVLPVDPRQAGRFIALLERVRAVPPAWPTLTGARPRVEAVL